MIEVHAPLRISFFGGGTDLPAYYRHHGGAVLSATIRHYVRVRLTRASAGLNVRSDAGVDPLVRACFARAGVEPGVGIEIASDVPFGMGLGSSSALAVALLQACAAARDQTPTQAQLAEAACLVEMHDLRGALGKQDQYAAAYGGVNLFEFRADERVDVTPLVDVADELAKRLLLFSTGARRRAEPLLAEHARRLVSGETTESHAQLVQLVRCGVARLREREWDGFCSLLDRTWELKRTLAPHVSNPTIDALYQRARGAGALGGKLLGAGGGGFLLVACRPEQRSVIQRALSDLRMLPFSFEARGSRLLQQCERRRTRAAATIQLDD